MKTVYVSHSSGFDYINDLYRPIRESILNSKYYIILPHEKDRQLYESKKLFREMCDFLVVEASYPKIGVGIEIGWADAFAVPVISMHKSGIELSDSLSSLSEETFEYISIDGMIQKLGDALKRCSSKHSD